MEMDSFQYCISSDRNSQLKWNLETGQEMAQKKGNQRCRYKGKKARGNFDLVKSSGYHFNLISLIVSR